MDQGKFFRRMPDRLKNTGFIAVSIPCAQGIRLIRLPMSRASLPYFLFKKKGETPVAKNGFSKSGIQ